MYFCNPELNNKTSFHEIGLYKLYSACKTVKIIPLQPMLRKKKQIIFCLFPDNKKNIFSLVCINAVIVYPSTADV